MLSWILRINLVAAIFSAPSFPAAVSSMKTGTLSPASSHALHTCPSVCPSPCPCKHAALSSFSFLVFLSTPFSVPSASPTKV